MSAADLPATGAAATAVGAARFGRGGTGWALFLLATAYAFSYLDRTIVVVLGEAIKRDMGLSDAQLGFLGGTTFAVFYAGLTLPLARLAERRSRTRILALCLVVWSAATTACGAAQTFLQLVLARVFVGAGEAGGQPTTHSLIADLYPPERRATATALFQLGVPAGVLIGSLLAGWLVNAMSWRAAFVVVGLPGILLAAVIWLTIAEPGRGRMEGQGAAAPPASGADTEPTPSLRDVFVRLRAQGVFVHVFTGAVLAAIAGNCMTQFLHPYFLRSHELDYRTAAIVFGFVDSFSLAAGILLGGLSSDFFARRKRWLQPLVPAAGLALAGPVAILGFGRGDWVLAAALLTLAGVLRATYFAPIYSVTHALLEPRMRATGAAILTVGLGLISLGLGPLLGGLTSDALAAWAYPGDFAAACRSAAPGPGLPACARARADGLAHALMLFSLLPLWAAAHFVMAARRLRQADAAA